MWGTPYRVRNTIGAGSELAIERVRQLFGCICDKRKSWLPATVAFDLFREHRNRPDPQATLAVERSINNVFLLALGISRDPEHFVLIAFEVAVAAEREGHGEALMYLRV